MVWLENTRGWRLHKWRRGHGISRTDPPLLRRVHQIGPAVLNGLLALGFWVANRSNHRYDERVMTVVTTIPISLLFGIWFFRPRELLVNSRQGIVLDGHGWNIRFPISQARLLLQRDRSALCYRLLIYDSRASWSRLIWETDDGAEALRVVAEVFGDSATIEMRPQGSAATRGGI